MTVDVLFWKDVYCHLFLDPRLVGGQWHSLVHRHGPGLVIMFDRLGNMTRGLVPSPEADGGATYAIYATYRIDGDSLIVTSPEDGEHAWTYTMVGDTLTLDSPGASESTYRRVPDDS